MKGFAKNVCFGIAKFFQRSDSSTNFLNCRFREPCCGRHCLLECRGVRGVLLKE